MKSKLSILVMAIFVFTLSSCVKRDAEDIVDCVGQSLLTIFNHQASTTNSHEITFSVTHSSDPQVQSVNWNFGDGNSQTVNSTSVTHTYINTGTYQVNFTVKLSNGCSYDKSKSITVQ